MISPLEHGPEMLQAFREGFIDQNQKITVAAMKIAEKNVYAGQHT